MQVQVDSEGVELFLELKETLKGSSEAIYGPGGNPTGSDPGPCTRLVQRRRHCSPSAGYCGKKWWRRRESNLSSLRE